MNPIPIKLVKSLSRRQKDLENKIKEGIKDTKHISKKLFYFDKLNSIAKHAEFWRGTLKGHAIVIAEEQYESHGRYNREWNTPKGGIWMSVLMPNELGERVNLLGYAIGLAAYEAVKPEIDCKLRWVNDIVYDNKILGSMIIRGDDKQVRISTGLNTNNSKYGPRDPKTYPGKEKKVFTSIKDAIGKEIDNPELIIKILNQFDKNYAMLKHGNHMNMLQDYVKALDCIGRKVEIYKRNGWAFTGIIEGVEECGALVVTNKKNKQQELLTDEEIFYKD